VALFRKRVSLEHLRSLTDDTGLLQHAVFGVPRRGAGYCTDDNARALGLLARLYRMKRVREIPPLATRYLAFLHHAQRPDGFFHNFYSYSRRWLDEKGGGDCQGRAIGAVCEVIGSRFPESMRAVAREIFERSRGILTRLRSPRSLAFALTGLPAAVSAYGEESIEVVVRKAADFLLARFRSVAEPGWEWFEQRLTYSNASLPHALLSAYCCVKDEEYLSVGLRSLDFLISKTFTGNIFVPVGNKGWLEKGKEPPLYDQQPVDAAAMVEACALCYALTGKKKYRKRAFDAFAWFTGRNVLREPLVDFKRGSCSDGLGESGPNRNQGAEATLSFLLSIVALKEMESKVAPSTPKAKVLI